jgi:ubiquinone/menaquinone biosynthesis C-methylase UbiE
LEEHCVTDLKALSPAEMASQLGKPEGDTGRAVGEMLNRVNANITAAVYQRLMLQAGHRVLEIGFGNGRLLPALLALAEDLTYVGLDHAETMVAEATTFNAELVAAGRTSFRLGSAEAIPCDDAAFDRAFAVNVIYFWEDAVKALAEMRRVLRPGGLNVIASNVSTPGEPPPAFARPEFGFHRRDRDTLVALHRQAGFSEILVDDYTETVTLPTGTSHKRNYAIVLARP